MKKLLALIALAAASMGLTAAQAATVSLTPTPQSKLLGSDVTMDIKISGLASNQIVSTFDLNIYFDPAVLKAKSFVINAPGAGLGGGMGGEWLDTSVWNPPADNFDLFAWSLEIDPNGVLSPDDALALLQDDGAFTIGTLTFETVGLGVSNVWFGAGANERDIVGRDATFLQDVQFQNACVAVNTPTAGGQECSTVPEPDSYALVGVALAGMLLPGMLRRRRR